MDRWGITPILERRGVVAAFGLSEGQGREGREKGRKRERERGGRKRERERASFALVKKLHKPPNRNP